MIVYLDMNVVFDYLVGRQPFGNEVARVLTILRGNNTEVFMAPKHGYRGFCHYAAATRQENAGTNQTLSGPLSQRG